jgi:aminocarboxymuconate-semialdehyde decarboxylase
MHAHAAIDIHAHYYPKSFLELVAKKGGPFGATCDFANPEGPRLAVGAARMPPLNSRFIDVDVRVAEMDDIGVEMHALSLTIPMVGWAGDDFAAELSRAFNDSCGEAHAKHPTRLVGLATLPWHAPALAVKELERAAKIPGIRGVYSSTRVRDRDLGEEAFFPIYEAIEGLGLNLFLHPVNVVEPERLQKFYLTNLLGNPFESAIAAAHLIFCGVIDRFPKMGICLPHAGGAFPYLVGRLQRGWQVRPELRHLERGPLEYIRSFHYDTVSHSPAALSYLIGLVGADRVMLGSDYCFDMGYERPVEVVTGHSGISADDAGKILGGNARRLLGV